MEQKISALENLKNVVTGAQNQEAQQQLSDLVKNSSLNMASYYKVNDDGSVDIPWNFKWSVSWERVEICLDYLIFVVVIEYLLTLPSFDFFLYKNKSCIIYFFSKIRSTPCVLFKDFNFIF